MGVHRPYMFLGLYTILFDGNYPLRPSTLLASLSHYSF